MANIKRITIDWSQTGITVFYIGRREVDDFRMDDSDGDFASAPSDPFQELTEDSVMKGRYESDESRVVWDDGRYTFTFYKQTGGSPAPASDTVIGTGEMFIKDDLEVVITSTLNANVVEISDDATAADNLELQFDGSGIVGDTFPSTQSQLAGIANVGSAVHRAAESYLLTTGTESANTVAETQALDGIRHEHTDAGGAMDLYYEFNIGSGIPSSVQFTGYVLGVNDDVDVFGFDWDSLSWIQIGNVQGGALANDIVESFDIFVAMVGSGANNGLVRIRFFKGAGLSTATLAVDQIFISYNQAAEGYQNAAIWFNSNASNVNTVRGVDGTATNPVSTMGAVNTLLASTNLSRIEIVSGSTVTLNAAQNSQVFSGINWTLDLNAQDIAGSQFIGASISGIAAGIGTKQIFKDCSMSSVTHIKGTHIVTSSVESTQTVGEAGNFFFDRCHSGIAGTGAWIFDFGAAIGDTNLNWRNGSGGIQLENMGNSGTDTASIEGRGQIIEGTCTAGIVAVRGCFPDSGITNLTLVDSGRFDSVQLVDDICDEVITAPVHNVKNSLARTVREIKESPQYEGGFIYINTGLGGSPGDEIFINGTLDNPVDNITDANTLSTSLGIFRFKVISDSSITLEASQFNQEFWGENWDLVLGGQNISGTLIHGADVSGMCTASIRPPKFEHCEMDGVTIPPCHMDWCAFTGAMIAESAGSFFFYGCHSAVAGISAPSFDFNASVGDVNLNMRAMSSGIELINMGQLGNDKASLEGWGQVIYNANSIGGTVAIRGHLTETGREAFIAAGGIIFDDARFDVNNIAAHAVNVISSLSGSIEVQSVKNGGTIVLYQNTAMASTIDLAKDMTGRKIFFSAVRDLDDAEYSIPNGGAIPKEITSDFNLLTGEGLLSFTAAELNIDNGILEAEVHSTPDAGGDGVPEMIFKIKLKDHPENL